MDLWYSETHAEGVKLSIEIDQHLYSAQSPFQRIDVFESKAWGRFFTLDGYVMITQKDEFIYHEMIVHVPMRVHPNVRNVLVIGAGDGGTVRELCRYNSVEHIDMVEIDELVVRTCQTYFPDMTASLLDPRVSLYFEDGLKFVHQKKNVYDLIIVDSTDPFGPGEGLFTKSFYQDCFAALTATGILVNQHESPFYPNYQANMKRAHQRIRESFPIAEVYQAFIPSYSSGHWLFGFASKVYVPTKNLKPEFTLKTQYYNTELHLASFALPNYVKKLLSE